MNILGINAHAHDSSAALIQDGRLTFAATEERFSRVKKDRSFPIQAIRAALEYGGVSFSELDGIAFGWNRPGVGPLHTIKAAMRGRLPLTPAWTAGQLYHAAAEVRRQGGLRELRRLAGPVARDKVFYIDHHEAHAWSTFGLSGWDDALVIVADAWGAWQSTSIYGGRGGRLERLKVFGYPNSLGVFYEGFTDLLGFERQNDEWKVMGLAAYGLPTVSLRECIQVGERGYKVNSRLLSGAHYGDLSRLTRRFGQRRNPEAGISQEDMDLAASVQRATEEAMFAVVRDGVRRTGSKRLCLAGGVAMNSKANGRILASGLVDEIFVQPAATDDGSAVGAALGAYAALGQPVPNTRMPDAYLGPEFSDGEIASAIDTYKIPSVNVPHVEPLVAQLLAQGKIVGWFQGRMEFGPRALGNRSILADPRRIESRDLVNECVKFREGWRPFAPSVLAEAAPAYFDGCRESPYMILTFDVRSEKRSVIPAVTHADNTARVQTVMEASNPRFHGLLSEFGRLTGVPVLLNTSFNLKGEPIVCSPKDAIRTFYSSGLDVLVLGTQVVSKDPGAIHEGV